MLRLSPDDLSSVSDLTARSSARRVNLETQPFLAPRQSETNRPWEELPGWPARWIRPPSHPPGPFVAAYRLDFEVQQPRAFRIHVSGDERYELFLDGKRIGRGPARAPRGWWYYESFDLELTPGHHSFAARVWSLANLSPWAQTSFSPGFLLATEAEDLVNTVATGHAGWRTKILPGYTFISPADQSGQEMGCGASFDIDGARFDWGWLDSPLKDWNQPISGEPGNSGFTLYIQDQAPWLRPSELPDLLDEPRFPAAAKTLEGTFTSTDFLNLSEGKSLAILPNQKIRIVLDWRDYVTAYPVLTVSGGAGAKIELGWCEAAADRAGKKIEPAATSAAGSSPASDLLAAFARPFMGIFDIFRPGGGTSQVFEPLWWRAGRFVVLDIVTAEAGLILECLTFRETRFPFKRTATWKTDDPRLDKMFTLCRRTLETCAHETFMDCPYWEQLQYAGDTRVQILLAYVLAGDDVLARRALLAFDASRRNRSGWPASSHPAKGQQSIPPFAFAWVGMLYEFALWRGDKAFVRRIMPAAREAVELWLGNRRADDLVSNPPGWNFLDWSGDLGQLPGPVHGALQWLLIGALRQMSQLEGWLGENEFAARALRWCESITIATEQFWVESTGLYADNLEKTKFSEHTNAFAILSGSLTPVRRARVAGALFDGTQSLTRTQIYATHYLFEAAAQCGRLDVYWKRLAPWLELVDKGHVTTPETFGVSRSECHAWGAHPLFHLYASVAGVRPTSFGFETVEFHPQPGPLKSASLVMAHPRGEIGVTWAPNQPPRITVPDGVNLT